MNKKIYPLILFAVFCICTCLAQTTTKLDLRLWKRLQQGKFNMENMPLLVRGELNTIMALTEKYGGIYKYGYNNISSIEIPEKNLLAFSTENAIERIEKTGGKGVSLMDTARIRNNIDSVQMGFAPLTGNLKGRNVVIGIIDGGIYWPHFDFRNPVDSSTRIKYIWDQVSSGANPPAPYGYGNQWDWNDINNGNCTHVPPGNDFGHGTCVAGIAAGNGFSTLGTAHEGEFTGVAPEADIIAVRIKYGNNYMTNVADAVKYIFDKADALGKPCVINTSIGTYYGSHDGIDLGTQLIEAQLDQHNGRVLVAAAGNAGNVPIHLGYDVPADSAYTFFKYDANNGVVYFDLWADTADFNNVSFKVVSSDNLGNTIASTQYFTVPADFHPPQGGAFVMPPINLPNGGSFDEVNMAASLFGSRYNVEFFIIPSDPSNYWRLQTSGSGKFDLWAGSAHVGYSDMTDYYSGNTYITDPHYRHPDTSKTMVTGWQNSDKVITVGNYSNRANYLDVDSHLINLTNNVQIECGTPVLYDEVVGRRFKTSSFGPTRDGRLKPDIMATGSTIMCTADANNAWSLLNLNFGCNRIKVAIGGQHIRNGGTSMASPIVAGVAALYLEKRPNASYAEIKQAIICSATKDNFTGPTANYEYGNGKLNAFAALTSSTCVTFGSLTDTSCLYYNPGADFDTGCVAKVYGITDTSCLNYDPLANVSSGICVPKVYGIMDTACINYNPLANVNAGICVPKVYGIMDTACLNYDMLANVNSGICIPKVYGITDTACLNYDALANVNSGICIPKVYGIMDTACFNYDPLANVNSGTCVPKVYGITDTSCLNFDPLANVSSGLCVPKVYGIMDTSCLNYDALANVNSGICVPKVYGVTDTSCLNYDPLANVNSGICIPKVYGIMDTACLNYNQLANVNGGTCNPKVYGIMDTSCFNFDPLANVIHGICVAKVYGIMDTACFNYNVLANVNSGICVAKVYGCTDTAANNYNPLANVEDSSCTYLSVKFLSGDKVSVRVIPNPFSSQTTFHIEGLNFASGKISIYNQLGELVDEFSLLKGQSDYIYNSDKLSKAIYYYRLITGSRNFIAGKLTVE